eukprot:361710-Chlamydomonas_euryale.AAC.3
MWAKCVDGARGAKCVDVARGAECVNVARWAKCVDGARGAKGADWIRQEALPGVAWLGNVWITDRWTCTLRAGCKIGEGEGGGHITNNK